MNIIVIGSTGQLGREFVKLGQVQDDLHVYEIGGREDADVADCYDPYRGQLHLALIDLTHLCTGDGNGQIHAVINTAALHNADDCVSDPVTAHNVNALGAANVAWFCLRHSDRPICVYISTDYVFGADRQKDSYRPLDGLCPYIHGSDNGVYGMTKAAGELATRAIAPRSLIVRVSTMFGPEPCKGKPDASLVERVIRHAETGRELQMTDDTRTSASYAPDVAEKVVSKLRKMVDHTGGEPKHDVMHAVCSNQVPHTVLAEMVYKGLGVLPSTDYIDGVVEYEGGGYPKGKITCATSAGTPRRSALEPLPWSMSGVDAPISIVEAVRRYIKDKPRSVENE